MYNTGGRSRAWTCRPRTAPARPGVRCAAAKASARHRAHTGSMATNNRRWASRGSNPLAARARASATSRGSGAGLRAAALSSAWKASASSADGDTTGGGAVVMDGAGVGSGATSRGSGRAARRASRLRAAVWRATRRDLPRRVSPSTRPRPQSIAARAVKARVWTGPTSCSVNSMPPHGVNWLWIASTLAASCGARATASNAARRASCQGRGFPRPSSNRRRSVGRRVCARARRTASAARPGLNTPEVEIFSRRWKVSPSMAA